MFKSEAKLFLSANNNINSAKTLINECKRLIVDFDLEGNSDCKNLKSNINNCNINALVNKVEDTKESLMKLDQGFASEYMTLLQEFLQTSTIDTSNMTEEEKMQYDIKMDAYGRDYNQTLLYMLEKYEESGMLTDEMKQQLQYQRETMAQYDIKDKMAVLDPTTDEYINLFKQCADYDRKLINLNPSLSEDEKASYLKEYNTQYNQNLDALINARDARLKREKDEKELEELCASKEDNNGFWHPFVESEIDEAILDKKIAMGIATKDEIAYKNMNGWDRFWTDTGTFAASTFTGLFNITEGIGDSFVMLGSAVNIVDKEWASDYISRDISGELYQGIQLSNNMNSYSAYGTWHTAGEAFGGFVGKAGITFAAPWASAALYGLDAMGQSAETSFNNGDDYWAAFGKSVVSGIGGAAEGYGLAKLNLGIRNFASSGALKTLGGTAWSGIKTTLTSPGGLKVVGGNLWNLAKSGVKHIPSALGKAGLSTLKDVDALIETGCVLANNSIECAQSGNFDLKKMLTEAGAVFAVNYFMNFATGLAVDINSSSSKPKIQTNFGSQKMNMDDLSYRRVGPVSSSYYMLESNVRKYSYVDTSTINGLNDSIKQNGLYHFTDSCDEILDSGYIKSSGYIASYGNKKSFFFNGVPDVGAYATNLDSLPLRTTAVKIMPDDDILSSSSLKVRHLDDQAITYDGNFKFSEGKATKEYFILVKENDKLVYRNVSKEIFDNYPNTESGKLLNDLVSKKSNVNMIKNDYYYNMSIKDTNTVVTTVTAGKSYESIFESDSLVGTSGLTSTGTANLSSELGDIRKFSDTTEAIKEKFCSTYDLDYYNDENSRKIVNSIMNLIEKNEFADESVKYLFANLDALKKQNPNLSIGYWESGSKFWGGANVLAMDIKDLDISEMVLSHELGHAIYDTVEGSAKTSWQPELTAKNQDALYKARENIARNRDKVVSILEECAVSNNKAFNETVAWYDGIRDAEVKRVSDIVDELYATQNVDDLKKIVESGSKMSQVKSILAEAGLSENSIDELISDKEIVKKIATVQNNINNQVAYCSKLNGSYKFYGDQRKMSSIIDSVTQSDESLKFTFGHNKAYWQTSGDLRAYNELLADYVSLSANGRFDTLKKLEEVCGTEIFDDIRETLSGIVGKIGG